MPISVIIGYLRFESKKAALEHFRRLRGRYQLGDRINGQDDLDLRAALAVHPDLDAKCAGQDVSHFEIRRYLYGKPAIFLVRADGSAVDLSVERAIGARP